MLMPPAANGSDNDTAGAGLAILGVPAFSSSQPGRARRGSWCRRPSAGARATRNEMITTAPMRPAVRSLAGMRRALAVAVAGTAALLTAGCTVPLGGVTGIGVDAKGNPVGYLQVCHDHIDVALIYIDDAHEFGRWSTSPAVTGFATWSLADPSGTWTAVDSLHKLKPRTTYSMFSGTNDDSSSTEAVDFTIEDLASMKPGQVRYDAGKTTSDGMNGVYSVTSAEQFRQTACKRFGS